LGAHWPPSPKTTFTLNDIATSAGSADGQQEIATGALTTIKYAQEPRDAANTAIQYTTRKQVSRLCRGIDLDQLAVDTIGVFISLVWRGV
jgi:hypothetical protein